MLTESAIIDDDGIVEQDPEVLELARRFQTLAKEKKFVEFVHLVCETYTPTSNDKFNIVLSTAIDEDGLTVADYASTYDNIDGYYDDVIGKSIYPEDF